MKHTFDFNAALRLGDWAAAAYDSEPKPADASTLRIIDKCANNRSAFRVLVGLTPIGSVVAFRGTVPPKSEDWAAAAINWFTNCTATLRLSPVGRIHEGFLATAEALLPDVLAALPNSEMPIHLTGHSLGGAVATVTAALLKIKGRSVADVYTFGSPRIGDAAFADFVLGAHRIENADDLVPHLPPDEPTRLALPSRLESKVASFDGLRGFQSAGPLTFIDWGGIVHVDIPRDREATLLVERLRRLAVCSLVSGPKKPFEDHNLKTYMERLRHPLRIRR